MTTLSRLFDFAAQTTIVSQEIDSELDQLVLGHNDLENDKVGVAGGTITGNLFLAGPAAFAANHAIRKSEHDTKLSLDGSSPPMTGELELSGAPTAAASAVPKSVTDLLQTDVDTRLLRAGDTMLGLLVLSGDPVVDLGAATKQFTELRVLKTGDTMTGNLKITAAPLVGNDVVRLSDTVNIAGDTMTGLLILSADPVADLGAATKQFAETLGALRVLRSGDTMSGNLFVPVNTTFQLAVVQKQFVDDEVALRLLKTGDTATGTINATGTSPNGIGFNGTGDGNGTGVQGNGGPIDGEGVKGFGGGNAGVGVQGTGGGTGGTGVEGTGGGTTGIGVKGTGFNNSGVLGIGGGLGAGVKGEGGATNGKGIVGQGTGLGEGVFGTGGSSGDGVTGKAGSGVFRTGVRGIARDVVTPSSLGDDTGVFGESVGGVGVHGKAAASGIATFGKAEGGIGVKGDGGVGGTGVVGVATGAGFGGSFDGLILFNMPTSSVGLPVGAVFISGGVLNIVT